MSKYKITLAIFVLLGIAAASFAQVNEEEMQNLPQIIFINFEGPHARIDTREQIFQIGAGLGRQVAAGNNGEVGGLSRYFVIHIISDAEDGKIDADIFGIGVDAGVDHIRNLRTIIQGYLQEAYSYSAEDAALLAEFITVYNAVYRGNWDYFLNRFKSPVIGSLVRDKAGLSIRFDEWPGRTMMTIPLGHGGLSSIDTTSVTDSRVIEEMRKEDDRSVPQRQGMVDLMEREADQAEQQAQAMNEAADEEEKAIAEERQQVAEQRQQTQEAQEAGTITEEEAAQQQQEADAKEEELDQREEAAAEQREEARRLEEFAEQKNEEAQQARQEIAEDQQAAIAQEAQDSILGAMIVKPLPTMMGRIVSLSPEGEEIKRSPVDTIHTRTITFVDGKIIAIAGEPVGRGAVRLIEINRNNLEMAKQGEDNIQIGSLLWVNGSNLYAITLDDGDSFLARFDTNLVLQAKSAMQVHVGAAVVVQQGRLLTQAEDGSVLMLNPADLTEYQP